jgi:hypothetical protein
MKLLGWQSLKTVQELIAGIGKKTSLQKDVATAFLL